MKLSNAVAATIDRWNTEALMFCAMHGKKGGLFDVYKWANGSTMAEPVMADGSEARANQCIPLEELNRMRRNGWKVFQD